MRVHVFLFYFPLPSSASGLGQARPGAPFCWREGLGILFFPNGTTTIADHLDRVLKDGAHTRWDVISPMRTLDAEYPPASERRRERQRETDRQCQHWAVDQDVFLGIAGRCPAQGGGDGGMGEYRGGRALLLAVSGLPSISPIHNTYDVPLRKRVLRSRGCSQEASRKKKK